MDFNPVSWAKRGIAEIQALPGRVYRAGARLLDRVLPDRLELAEKMPPYSPLPAAERARAEARSHGLALPQHVSTKEGATCEPVTLEIHGSLADVRRALGKAGWAEADKNGLVNSLRTNFVTFWHALGGDRLVDAEYERSPMSTLTLHGKPQVAGFEKNNDHHVVRDHIRVFDSGRRDAQGRPVWEVTASRDTGITYDTKGSHHQVDLDLDKERDMLAADLLGTGLVSNWRVARGELEPGLARALDAKGFRTDGRIYVMDVGR